MVQITTTYCTNYPNIQYNLLQLFSLNVQITTTIYFLIISIYRNMPE
nr:MAG TPA: hypothetical protein [Caudoviricetes sp.]